MAPMVCWYVPALMRPRQMLHSNHFFRSAYRTPGRFHRFMRRTAKRAGMAPLAREINARALRAVHYDVRSNPGRPGIQILLVKR